MWMIMPLSSSAKCSATPRKSNRACDTVYSLISSHQGSSRKVIYWKRWTDSSVRDTTSGQSKSLIFIALSLGPFGVRGWNWDSYVAHIEHGLWVLSFLESNKVQPPTCRAKKPLNNPSNSGLSLTPEPTADRRLTLIRPISLHSLKKHNAASNLREQLLNISHAIWLQVNWTPVFPKSPSNSCLNINFNKHVNNFQYAMSLNWK